MLQWWGADAEKYVHAAWFLDNSNKIYSKKTFRKRIAAIQRLRNFYNFDYVNI